MKSVFTGFIFLSLSLLLLDWSGVEATRPRAERYTQAELSAVETARESQIRNLRISEIQQLNITISRRLPENQKTELYFRLAELYLEAYNAQFLLEGRVHERRLKEGRKATAVDRSSSTPFLRRGIQACQQILRLKIQFSKMDRVYYFLAYYHDELNDEGKAQSYYRSITQKFPRSPFAVEAYRELGRFSFEKNDFRKAQEYLESATALSAGKEDPSLYHSLAWSYYRTRRYDRAIQTMKNAIRLSKRNREKYLSIQDEALRDMALFMTEQGRVEEAIAYFREVSPDSGYYARTLEKLGREYERKVQRRKAFQVYEALLKADTRSSSAFRVLVKLVDLDLKQKKFSRALERIRKIKIPDRSDLENVETKAAFFELKGKVRKTATDHHERFRRSGKKGDLLIAEGYYEIYLNRILEAIDPDELKDKSEGPEMKIYLGEIKFELGKRVEATRLYREVLKSGDNRYSKEAATLWVGTLEERLKTAAEAGKTGSRSRPSEVETEFIEAVDELQFVLPASREAREAALKAAQVLAGYPKTEDLAVQRCRDLIRRNPRSRQAQVAALLWIQVLADRVPDPQAGSSSFGNFGKDDIEAFLEASKELESALEELRSDRELIQESKKSKKRRLVVEIDRQQSRIQLGRIYVYDLQGKFEQAGSSYLDFAESAKKETDGESAYRSAIQSYLKARKFAEADRALSRWFTRYPKSKEVRSQSRELATQFLVFGEFERSAARFETLGKLLKEKSALLTAARIYEGIRDYNRTRSAWVYYLEKFPKDSDRWGILYRLAEVEKRFGKKNQAETYLKICRKGPKLIRSKCGAALADLHFESGSFSEAKKVYAEVASMARRSSRKSRKKKRGNRNSYSPYVGYSQFRLGEMMESEGKFRALSLPEDHLKKGLDERSRFLGRLSQTYLKSVEAGGVWGVSALHRLSLWTYQFATEVSRIKPPVNFSREQVKRFNTTLKAFSGPLKKQATENWKEAYREAVKSETLSPAVPEIADQLAELRVDFPFRAQGYRGRFRISGIPARGKDGKRDQALESVRKALSRDLKSVQFWLNYGNLLWGGGNPLLARICYDQALKIDPNHLGAMNNQAVMLLSAGGSEDWVSVSEAFALLRRVLKKDEGFLVSQMNLAILFNYYRLFSKAEPLWESLLQARGAADVYDGAGIAFQGLGEKKRALEAFRRAQDSDAPSVRFARIYHEAAWDAFERGSGPSTCLQKLKELKRESLRGFEIQAVRNLERTCRLWKGRG